MTISVGELANYFAMAVMAYFWWDYRTSKKAMWDRINASLTKTQHDEVCGLKMAPMLSDIQEIKAHVRMLVNRKEAE